MIAIETHPRNSGETLDKLESIVPLQKKIILYDTPHDPVDPEYLLLDSLSGEMPDAIIDSLDGDEFIITGGYYGACHYVTFQNLIKQKKSGDYHFIQDLMYSLRDFNCPDTKDKYSYTAKRAGFTVQVYSDGQKEGEFASNPEVNIYYWSSLDAFAAHVKNDCN